MAYSFAEYQADRTLLLYRSATALPVPGGLKLKRDVALLRADPDQHPAIEAAYARLLVVAEAGPDAVPRPPADPVKRPENRRSSGTRSKADRAGEGKPSPLTAALMADNPAIWEAVLRAQMDRHTRRRSEWPAVAPKAGS